MGEEVHGQTKVGSRYHRFGDVIINESKLTIYVTAVGIFGPTELHFSATKKTPPKANHAASRVGSKVPGRQCVVTVTCRGTRG